MPSGPYKKVKLKILSTVGLVLLLLAFFFYWSFAKEYRILVSNAEKSSANYASALKEHGERVFTDTDNSLKNLQDDINENGGLSFTQSARFYELLKQYALSGPQFSSVFIVDASGMIIAHSGEFRMKPVNVADRDYFLVHRDYPSTGMYMSKPFTSRVSGTSRFCLSRPVRNTDGKLIALVAATFETKYFENFYKSLSVGSRGRIILATTGGDMLIMEPHQDKPPLIDLATSSLFKTMIPAARTGTHHIISPVSSDMRIVSYHTFDTLPLVAIVSMSKADVTAHWLSSCYVQGSILLLLMVVIFLLSLLLLRQLKVLEETNDLLDLEQSDNRTKVELLDSATDAVLLLDVTGRLCYFNEALCRISGYSREGLENRLIQEIEPPEHAARVVGNIQKLIARGGDAQFESAYLHLSGSIVPIEVNARPIEIQGKTFILSVVRNISERKLTEQKLAVPAREWQETFDSSADAIWLLDMERTIIRANKATQAIFGLSVQEVCGRSCCDIAHHGPAPHANCPFDQMVASGRRAAMELQIGANWYDVSLDPVFDELGRIVRAVHLVKDISALKKSELREHVRSEMLERIARGESLQELLGFIALSVEKERSGALCSILLVSEDGKRLLNGAAPSLPAAYNLAVDRTKIGEGVGSCGTAAFRKERVIVEDTATHPFWKGFTPAEEAGLRSCWSEPIFSSSGKLLGTFAIYHREPSSPGEDELRLIEQASAFAGIAIERHRAETERSALEEQLHQSQKMEAIGHLAGGMAHDFNNLLTPIMVCADMLKKSTPNDDERTHSMLAAISRSSLRARDLTNQLLGFGRKQIMQTSTIDLNEIVNSFFPMIRRPLRENIDIQLQLSSQPQVILADRSKIEQIILNLAINAQNAIADNGTIVIETGQVLIDDEYAHRHQGITSGMNVLLSCRDSGCGMADSVLQHIFEPFFTTRPVGHGTGLGLANVYGIVKQHNGYIEVQSTVGKGTCFKIYFPASASPLPPAEQEKDAAITDQGGNATILLVEDNEMVREMVGELLAGLGYRVYLEDDPMKALERAQQIGRIDLLITDVVMPGMNGRQLFERLSAERADIGKVLYMSGYTNDVFIKDGQLQKGIRFIQKPFTVDAFMEKITALLEE